MTAEVGAYEAKTHLPALLARVQRGERITITRHGQPIALLVPAQEPSRVEEAIEGLLALRRELETDDRGGVSVRELIAEGRR